MSENKSSSSYQTHLRLILQTIGIVVGLLLLWVAVDVFLLVFAAILLSLFLNALGKSVQRYSRLPYPLALLAALIIIAGIFYITILLYTPLISEQSQTLVSQLPQAYEQFKKLLLPYFNWTLYVEEGLKKELLVSNEKIIANIAKIFSFTVGSIVGFFVFLLIGFYLAFNPGPYIRGFLKLFPPKKRERAQEIFFKTGLTLKWWLLGKCISMIFTGVAIFTGLRLLNVSLAFILALIAALLTFIPYVGPILSSIPGILIGFAQSPLKAVYVAILYLCVYVVEGYFVTPFIEQRAVSLPPALTITVQILLTFLIGFLGLALATPLAVLFVVVIQQLYIKRYEHTTR